MFEAFDGPPVLGIGGGASNIKTSVGLQLAEGSCLPVFSLYLFLSLLSRLLRGTESKGHEQYAPSIFCFPLYEAQTTQRGDYLLQRFRGTC